MKRNDNYIVIIALDFTNIIDLDSNNELKEILSNIYLLKDKYYFNLFL